MRLDEQIEGAHPRIAIIESFYVLLHDSKDVYLVGLQTLHETEAQII